MSDETKVWIVKKKLKSGKQSYRLRWIDYVTGKWQSETVGTDRKAAEDRAADIRKEVRETGGYFQPKRCSWDDFVAAVKGDLTGKRHGDEVGRTLTEFHGYFNPRGPAVVDLRMVKDYIIKLREKGNAPGTINKKLRCLRVAFSHAVDDGFIQKSPIAGKWDRISQAEEDREKRILKRDEESKLLKAAHDLHGLPMTAFIRFTLASWARLGEATKLTWADVRFRDSLVWFRSTKSHEDRKVPIAAQSRVWRDLTRLQAMTLQEGGPFMRFADRHNLHKKWLKIVEAAAIDPVTIHDLRRTGITRALLANVPPVTVKTLAGHSNIKTTMDYYLEVDEKALREGAKMIHRTATAAG
jgi:integrase